MMISDASDIYVYKIRPCSVQLNATHTHVDGILPNMPSWHLRKSFRILPFVTLILIVRAY